MKETEDQYEDWKNGASKKQEPIAKAQASIESNDKFKIEIQKEMKEEKKELKKEEQKDEAKEQKK